ncbi:MAG TPA: twin-arginine translocase subunit TatC, partial [Rhodospirillales bacterium]|nr:twin-arginine translocase subunit TatC [Rhodospirillales bacterium]
VYYFIFPLAWSFFLSFESVGGAGALPIQLEAKVDQYLSLVMRLIFAFGLCFELPVVMTLLGRVGMVTSKGMKEKRKYAIVLAFVAAAILTPPDVISQIGLALPTMLLYEISIISVKIVEKKRGDVDEDEEDDDDEDEEEEDVVDMDESDEADDLASP